MIQKAINFAKEKHKGQTDDMGLDYFTTHCLVVFKILKTIDADDNLLCAGLLHDVLEDTQTTYEELASEFGMDVASLVKEVSHEGKRDNIGFYFPYLETERGIVLKFADRISNLSRMECWGQNRTAQYLKRSIFFKQFPKFGRLEVQSKVIDRNSHLKVLCVCDCGNQKEIRLDHLESGATTSCGCLQKERASKANTIHGLTKSPTYYSWINMKNRCDNPKTLGYKYYGGRGIKYDERWSQFSKFLEDMGEKPKNRSIDRINNDGNYCKENCRWATVKEQANNKRNNRILEYNGEKKTVAQWAEIHGMDYHEFAQKLKYEERVVDGKIVKEFWKSSNSRTEVILTN